MKQAITLYQSIIQFYPKEFKKRFQKSMMQTFADRYNDEKLSYTIGMIFWIKTILDELKNIIHEYFILFLTRRKNTMNKFWFGIVLGVISSIAVVFTNVIFTNNAPDNGSIITIAYFGYFILIAIGGIIASRKTKSLKDAAIGGAVTSFITAACILVTFIVVDNMFLNIVSQQSDKIWGFANQHTYHTMRDFINDDNMRSFITVLPIATIGGAFLGMLGRGIGNIAAISKVQSSL